MADFRYPNESDEYRESRDALLAQEIELRARSEAVAQQRRELPRGGRVPDGYVFERIGQNGEVLRVPFADLFGERDQLLVYTMMFGPDWDAACPSCTSIVDGIDSNYVPVSNESAVAIVAAAGPEQLRDFAAFRGWRVPVLSARSGAGDRDYIRDYFPFPDATDMALASCMNSFERTADGDFHVWGSELLNHPMANGHPRHVDPIWPLWSLLDMTRGGRGRRSTPRQDFEHRYFTENVFREPE